MDYCDVFISCLDSYSDSTLFTAEDPLVRKWCKSALMKKHEEERWRQLKKLVYILDGQRVNTFQHISFWWTIPLKHIFISRPNPEKLTVHLFAGMNSIFVYVGHSLLGFYFPFSWEMRYQDSHWEKLFQNIWGTALWVFIAYLLFRKKFFLKIWCCWDYCLI